MNNEPVVRLLAEGGCFEVFGRKTADGQWVFNGRVTAMTDVDEWNAAAIPETTALEDLLPDIWPRLTPILVHPELRRWFAERFNAESASEYHRARWQALFASTPPDKWSEDR